MVIYSQTTSPNVTVTVTEASGTAVLTLSGPATIVEDTVWSFTGRLTGTGGVGIASIPIDILYSTDSGVNWTKSMTVNTNSTGNYSGGMSFVNPGTVLVHAYWSGGSIPG